MAKHVVVTSIQKKIYKNFMATFYGWRSTASRLVPLRGSNLLFTAIQICISVPKKIQQLN